MWVADVCDGSGAELMGVLVIDAALHAELMDVQC
jgi:hypothetical protein